MSSLRIILIAALCGLYGCIPSTSDPVSVGEFCIGETDCQGSVLLEREAIGRSRIDFAVTNTGSDASAITVQALVPLSAAASVDAGGDASIALEDRVVVQRLYSVEAGASTADRLAATELGTRRNIELAMQCDGCSARLEYVFEAEPLECRDQDDCSSGWFCDPALGRCAECLSDLDCDEEQICESSGRCLPQAVEAGCTTGPTGAPFGSLLILLGAFASSTILRRRRRIVLVASFVGITAFASTASAAAPGAGISLGAGPRWVTGELSPVVERGIGISLGQELRWDYVGIGVQLNWATFLTTQEPPPFSRNIQIFDFTVGPRGYLPLGDFDLVLSTDYKRIGLAANSLVRITGTQNGYHAFGGVLGARWDGLGIELRLDAGVHHIPGLSSQIVMFELSAALTAGR